MAVVFSVASTGTGDNGWQTLTGVFLITAANMGAGTGDQVRLTVKINGALTIGNGFAVYIAQQASSGDAYDFANTPSHVTFGGGDAVGDSTTVTWVSDWVNLPEAYDETKTYLVSAQFTGGTNIQIAGDATSGSTGNTTYFKTAADAATVNKSGYSAAYRTNETLFVKEIEVQTAMSTGQADGSAAVAGISSPVGTGAADGSADVFAISIPAGVGVADGFASVIGQSLITTPASGAALEM